MAHLNGESWNGLQLLGEWIQAKRLVDLAPAVAIFGSARLPQEHESCRQAFALAKRLSERGFTVLTGGGPGVMEAANAGAQAGQKGASVGLNIKLPHEQHPNAHQDVMLHFDHFPTRKMAFTEHACAYVIFPGGMGTLDELFEVWTLIQTQKMPTVPVFLYGSAFWTPLLNWLRDVLVPEGTIAAQDLDLVRLVDATEEVDKALAPGLENQ